MLQMPFSVHKRNKILNHHIEPFMIFGPFVWAKILFCFFPTYKCFRNYDTKLHVTYLTYLTVFVQTSISTCSRFLLCIWNRRSKKILRAWLSNLKFLSPLGNLYSSILFHFFTAADSAILKVDLLVSIMGTEQLDEEHEFELMVSLSWCCYHRV